MMNNYLKAQAMTDSQVANLLDRHDRVVAKYNQLCEEIKWYKKREQLRCDVCNEVKSDTRALYHNDTPVMRSCLHCIPAE